MMPNNAAASANANSLTAKINTHGGSLVLPKLSASDFKIPPWGRTYSEDAAWQKAAFNGLERLNAFAILQVGYAPRVQAVDLVDQLPKPQLTQDLNLDSIIDLTMDGPTVLPGATPQAVQPTVKVESAQSMPTPQTPSTKPKKPSVPAASPGSIKHKLDAKDLEIARLRDELAQASKSSSKEVTQVSQMIEAHRVEMAKQTELAAQRLAHPKGEQEMFVVRNKLKLYMSQRRVFVHPDTGAVEPAYYTQVRNFLEPIWRKSFSNHPEVIKGVIGADLLQIVVNQSNYAQPLAATQYAALSKAFSAHTKTNKISFSKWEDLLNVYLQQMAAVGHPKPDYEVKAVLIAAFEEDNRYKLELREVNKRPDLEYQAVLNIFRNRAIELKDMAVTPNAHNATTNQSEKTKEKRKAKKGRKKKKGNQAAFNVENPPPPFPAAPAANAATDYLNKLCYSWLSDGYCCKKDCPYMHIKPDELAKRIKNAKATNGGHNANAAASGSSATKTDCRHWLNGHCHFGDKCSFLHVKEKKGKNKLEEGHMAKTHYEATHSIPAGIMPTISDIIVPDELCAPAEQPGDLEWNKPEVAENTNKIDSFESMWLQSLQDRATHEQCTLADSLDAGQVHEHYKIELQTSDNDFVEQISPKISKTQGPLWEDCDAWNANDKDEHCTTYPNNPGGDWLFNSETSNPFKTIDVSFYYVYIFMFFGLALATFSNLAELYNSVKSSLKAFLKAVHGTILVRKDPKDPNAKIKPCEVRKPALPKTFCQFLICALIFNFNIALSPLPEFSMTHEAHMARHSAKVSYKPNQEVIIISCLQCPALVDEHCHIVQANKLNDNLVVYSVSFEGTGRKLTRDEKITCGQGFLAHELRPANEPVSDTAMNVTSTSYEGRAIIDSGATNGFINKRSLFVPGTIHKISPQAVTQAAGSSVNAIEAGLVRMYANTPKYYGQYIQFTGLYTPTFTRSLVPASALDEQGYYITLGGNSTMIRKGPSGPILIKVNNANVCEGQIAQIENTAENLYPLPDYLFSQGKPPCPDGNECKHDISFACNEEAHATRIFNGDEHMLTNYHCKIHHCSMDRIARMIEWDTGVAPPIPPKCRWCLACQLAKITNSPYKRMNQELVARAVFDNVTADLVVNMPCTSLRGYKHYINATDWKSGHITGFLLKHRGEAAGYFLTYLKRGKTQHGRSPKRIIIDGGELRTKEIISFAGLNGTEIIINPAGQHPNAMGKAEQVNRNTQEAERSYLQHGNAPEFLWEFATVAAWCSSNVIPSARAMRKGNVPKDAKARKSKRPLTPLEMWEGRRADSYAELRANLIVPFCECVAYINKEDRSAHVMPGFRALYLCPAKTNMLTERTHYVLRLRDWKLMKVRTVHANESVFPLRELRPSGVGEFKPYATTSGGVGDIVAPTPNKHLEEDDHPLMQYEESDREEEVVSSIREPTPAKVWFNEKEGKANDKPPPLEPNSDEDDELHTVIDVESAMTDKVDRQHRVLRSTSSEAPEMNESESALDNQMPGHRNYKGIINDGSAVMTKFGPATVTGRQGSDYLAIYDNEEKEYSLPSGKSSIWLAHEKPSVIYNAQGLLETLGGDTANHVEYAPYVPMAHTPKYPLRYANARIVHHEANLAEGVFKSKSFDELLAEARTMPADEVDAMIPRHFHQTLYHPLRPLIEQGEIDELRGLLDIGVFAPPQECPQGYKPVDLMWVYKAKKGEEDSFFAKMKARCTMMGNQEKHSIEKLAAYAPVMQQASLRVMLALYNGVAGVRFHTSDIKQAYVSTAMKRRVFVNMPPGYEVHVDKHNQLVATRLPPGQKQPERKKRKVMLLLRALYGGMECGRLFWDSYIEFHEKLGFKKIHEDQCYLAMHKPNGDFIRILIHVDDSVIAQRGDDLFKWYQDKLGERFEFVLNPLKRCLGIDYEIDYENSIITMNQYDHVVKMLRAFNMQDCKAESHPMPRNVTLSEATVPTDPDEIDKYKKQFNMERALGYFNWIAGGTRPDICLALKHLSRFAKAYGPEHIAAAKHLMRYLKGTARKCLIYRAGMEPRMQVFTDASHAGCPDTRRSITGVVIKFAGCTIFWLCLYQKIVSHSSCESELMALDKGATTGRFVRWLLEAMGAKRSKPTNIFVDNQGTIDIAVNPVQAGRNKHVHARYFYVRDLVKNGEYVIVHLRTDEQISDVLCANKGTKRFAALVHLLMDCAMTEFDEQGIPQWKSMLVGGPSA